MSAAVPPIPRPLPDAPGPDAPRQGRAWTAFAVVALILLVSLAGLEATARYLKLTFRKLPVEPSAPLISVAQQLGPWVQASVDRPLNPDFEHELGTRLYIMREYLDTRLISDADLKKFRAANMEDREKMLREGVIRPDPRGKIRFALTYYTGSADTVPHVPERCFAADGWKPSTFDIATWPILPRESPQDRNTQVRVMNFEDQIGSRAYRPTQVCYFFQVNGGYEQDPIFGVRQKLQNLLESRAYFAKIELVTGLPEAKDAGPVMKDFLIFAMPEIERVLPDWRTWNAAPASSPATQPLK